MGRLHFPLLPLGRRIAGRQRSTPYSRAPPDRAEPRRSWTPERLLRRSGVLTSSGPRGVRRLVPPLDHIAHASMRTRGTCGSARSKSTPTSKRSDLPVRSARSTPATRRRRASPRLGGFGVAASPTGAQYSPGGASLGQVPRMLSGVARSSRAHAAAEVGLNRARKLLRDSRPGSQLGRNAHAPPACQQRKKALITFTHSLTY